MDIQMTAGNLPTRAQFDQQCDVVDPDDGHTVNRNGFRFGNDKRLGNVRLSADELWDELVLAMSEYESFNEDGVDGAKADVVSSWISDVLYCLGIEWV